MDILGIENRTENWKTAVYFSPLFGGRSNRLAERLGETPSPLPEHVTLELFWKGMRDYLYVLKKTGNFIPQDLADRYNCMFLICEETSTNSVNFATQILKTMILPRMTGRPDWSITSQILR